MRQSLRLSHKCEDHFFNSCLHYVNKPNLSSDVSFFYVCFQVLVMFLASFHT